MTVITAIFTYQTVIAESADNTILKTARFAMGSLPIVGGAISEASRTLLGAFELVKNLTGGLGVCLILLIVIPPIVYLLMSKVTLSLSKILANSLECPPVAAIIKGAEDILSFSIAILIIFDITAIFTLGVFLVISS
jgi:stage III sporulation protein AE